MGSRFDEPAKDNSNSNGDSQTLIIQVCISLTADDAKLKRMDGEAMIMNMHEMKH